VTQLAAPVPKKSSGIETVLMQLPGGPPDGQGGHVGQEIKVSVNCAALGLEHVTLADTVASPVSWAMTAPEAPQKATRLFEEFLRSTSAKL
jgi:hypothetical protein